MRASPTAMPLTRAQETASQISTSGSAGFSGGFLPVATVHDLSIVFFATAAAVSADATENALQIFDPPSAMAEQYPAVASSALGGRGECREGLGELVRPPRR